MNEHLADALTEEAKQHKTFDIKSGKSLLTDEQLAQDEKENAQSEIPVV